MGIIFSLLLGCLAGFCAGKLMKGGGFGLIMNIVLGLLGGALGGWHNKQLHKKELPREALFLRA